jgi:hypothetical protein
VPGKCAVLGISTAAFVSWFVFTILAESCLVRLAAAPSHAKIVFHLEAVLVHFLFSTSAQQGLFSLFAASQSHSGKKLIGHISVCFCLQLTLIDSLALYLQKIKAQRLEWTQVRR